MDKKTRLLSSIDGKKVDRLPFTFWHHYSGDQMYGKACIDAHKRIYDEVGLDFIKMMSDGYNNIDFGVTVKTPADWKNIKIPKMTDPFVVEQLDRIKMMREAIKDEAYIYYVIFAAFTLMRITWGPDMCYAHMKDPEARKFILPALNNLGDFVAEAATLYITEGGLLGDLHSFSSCASDRFTEQQYRDWMRPEDLKLVDATNAVSDYNIVHFCGWSGVPNHMEAWKDYTGAVAHWDIHTDHITIEQAGAYFPNKRALMGGFDNKPGSVLYSGTEDEVKAATRDIVRQAGETGFIVTSDCSMYPEIEYKRLIWVREALEEMAAE